MERKRIKNSNEKNIRKKSLGDWTKNQEEFLDIKNITSEFKNSMIVV